MATQTICDRCRRQVLDDHGIKWGDLALHRKIERVSAPGRTDGPVIDLCGPCQADLDKWFRQGSLR